MNEVYDPRAAGSWSERITACWRQSVEAIIETGRLLSEAKAALPRGDFTAMIEAALPFSARTAQRLMTIGADARLANPTHVSHLPPSWGTLYELTKLSDDQFTAGIESGTIRPDIERREVINGARSIMGSRQEPDDSLDYFPTPPWATRALCHHVMPAAGFAGKRFRRVWEPACGEGHMAEVLAEYADKLIASDVHDYGYGRAGIDFLVASDMLEDGADWIISNPPFGDLTEAFVLKALAAARVGVAMFVRLQWLESVGRYEAIFRDHPPTVIAFFAERVNLCKGRWEPDGSTATAYIWLVWAKGEKPRAPFWIPPGRREALTRPDDRERFTAHPVTAIDHTHHDPDTGEIIEQSPQHGADTSVRTDFESASAPVDDGGQDTAGAGVRVAPAPVVPIDLDIPDSLRRVAMTEDEAATIADLDPSIMPVNERNFVVNLRDRERSAFTVMDRKYLAKVAEKFGAGVPA